MQKNKPSIFDFDAQVDNNGTLGATGLPVGDTSDAPPRTPPADSNPRRVAWAKIGNWGGIGAFWGGIAGLLLAPAGLFPSGFGLLDTPGPAVAALGGALEGAMMVGGVCALGALGATLMSRRILIGWERGE